MTEEEKKDKRMVWALIKLLNPEWDQTLSRIPKIDEKSFEEIAGLMDVSFLERNPLVVQRLSSLTIFKAKEESVSDCLRRIHDSYHSGELDNAPVETRALLHLLTFLPSDPLSKKIKTYLAEKWGSPLTLTIWKKFLPIFSPRRLMILLARAFRRRLVRVS